MLDDIIRERLRKIDLLKQEGLEPFPVRTQKTHSIKEVRETFDSLMRSRKKISIAGRVVGMRDQGNLIFADIKDGTGQIQAVLKKENLKDFKVLKDALDRGDFANISGVCFITKKGEKSIEAKKASILAKSLRPLPTQFYGIEDAELRLRQRYLDILLNPEAKELFEKKDLFWGSFRDSLKEEGFLEVETPVFEILPGGAEAEPFKTHHNALDQDFYLRISLELSLKKLLVAGYEKIFEIGRIFRNEGIDREHLQDYTQLEFYWAYADYAQLMKFVEKIYKRAIRAVTGKQATVWQGHTIKWGGKWPLVDYVESFRKAAKLDPLSASREELLRKAESFQIETEPSMGRGRLIDAIFKKTVRPTLIQPCFLVNPPVSIEPLAKRSQKNPEVVERFQVMACGTELGKGFSELNDPIDQRARFEEQMKLREAGDKEAQHLDEDFLEALEYGMPPAAGFGTSERLFSILMDKPIRETVIFPLLRSKK
jgi:lysyl-tRNA synthetase class 2